jgi:alpha-beta hydrolase superfamily lysophospholipase
MKSADFGHVASDGKEIRVHRWLPDGAPKALLLVAHGMAEHATRYGRLAEKLASAGWAVYAPDHRGHGDTAGPGELGWFAERDGFRRVVDDLHEIAEAAKAEYEGLPLFLLGHSMGSILSEAYMGLYGGNLAGCALSGVVEPPAGGLLPVARFLAAVGCLFKGQRSQAPLLDTMSFGAYNKGLEPVRTKFDWLSRDGAEVDKYVADPFCGFVCTDGFFRDLLSGFRLVYGEGGALSSLPAALPIIVMAGESDPCGGARGFPEALVGKLKAAGVVDVQKKTYPGARHEILNETNRDEVSRDLLAWLEGKAAGRRS